jgi:hypothetical protein
MGGKREPRPVHAGLHGPQRRSSGLAGEGEGAEVLQRTIVKPALLDASPVRPTSLYFPGFSARLRRRPENRNLLGPAVPWWEKPPLSFLKRVPESIGVGSADHAPIDCHETEGHRFESCRAR